MVPLGALNLRAIRAMYLPAFGIGYISIQSNSVPLGIISVLIAVVAALSEASVKEISNRVVRELDMKSPEDMPMSSKIWTYTGREREIKVLLGLLILSFISSFPLYLWFGLDLILGTLLLIQLIAVVRTLAESFMSEALDISEELSQ